MSIGLSVGARARAARMPLARWLALARIGVKGVVRTAGVFMAMLSAVLFTAGCGAPAVSADAVPDLLWPERQVVFRLLTQPLRLEAYGIRGGVAPLGTVRLPDGMCPQAMALDAATGRIWLWGEGGGAAVDGRSLQLSASWEVRAGEGAAVVYGRAGQPPAHLVLAARALPPMPTCGGRERMAEAVTAMNAR